MSEQKNSKSGIIFWHILTALNAFAASSYFIEDVKNPDADTTLMVVLLTLNTLMAGYGSYKAIQKYSDIKKLQQQR